MTVIRGVINNIIRKHGLTPRFITQAKHYYIPHGVLPDIKKYGTSMSSNGVSFDPVTRELKIIERFK